MTDQPSPLSDDRIGEVRRWLWEQFNVRRDRRPRTPALAVTLWDGEPITAAHALKAGLAHLVHAGHTDPRDAVAWAKAASLDGRRTPRHEVAAALGVTERGLHNRVRRVDADLARHADVLARTPTSPSDEAAVQGLVESVRLRAAGRHDEADGVYSAAAEFGDVATRHRARNVGRDRTRRARAKHQARLGLPLRVGTLPLVTGLFPGSDLVACGYRLADTPGEAVAELHRAWRAGDREALPLLLTHAARLVPDERVAGVQVRLALLEVGSNLLRDSESLLAVEWTTAWLDTARRRPGTDLHTVKARRTRAHVLQLHGFHRVAARELDLAYRSLADVRAEREFVDAEAVDVLLRRSSVEIAVDRPDGTGPLVDRAFHHDPNEGLLPGLLRNRLHSASLREAADRGRRTFGGRRSSAYEQALDGLVAVMETVPAPRRAAVLDTMITAATRVGDLATVRTAVGGIEDVLRTAGPNLLWRLKLHIASAARLPGLHDLADYTVPITEDPLRLPHLIPHNPRNLV
ncbi:hypothetical protein ACQPW3_26575 [Actinosynnema sp. CA-248983]